MYNSGNTITHWVLIERKCFMYIEYTKIAQQNNLWNTDLEYGVALFPFPSYWGFSPVATSRDYNYFFVKLFWAPNLIYF